MGWRKVEHLLQLVSVSSDTKTSHCTPLRPFAGGHVTGRAQDKRAASSEITRTGRPACSVGAWVRRAGGEVCWRGSRGRSHIKGTTVPGRTGAPVNGPWDDCTQLIKVTGLAHNRKGRRGRSEREGKREGRTNAPEPSKA